MNTSSKRIGTGSKVAIIGGGPAGSFFALYLRNYAEERGIQLQITIYQQRNFSEVAPKDARAALVYSLCPCSGI